MAVNTAPPPDPLPPDPPSQIDPVLKIRPRKPIAALKIQHLHCFLTGSVTTDHSRSKVVRARRGLSSVELLEELGPRFHLVSYCFCESDDPGSPSKLVKVLEKLSGETPVFSKGSQIETFSKRGSFTWKVENFLSFKEIMKTRLQLMLQVVFCSSGGLSFGIDFL